MKLGKMNIMKVITQNPSHSTVHIGYESEFQKETMNKFSSFINLHQHKLEERFSAKYS